MTSLICDDGSADAQAAIDRAGLLMAGSEATVLVIGGTVLETVTRHGSLGVGLAVLHPYGEDDANPVIEKATVQTGADGVQRAVAVGLIAQSRVVDRTDDIATVILAEAADLDADVVVLGTPGWAGVKSLMLGSVSAAVLHHARPTCPGGSVPRAAPSLGRARPDRGRAHMSSVHRAPARD